MNISPSSFDEYIGQGPVKKNLQVILDQKHDNYNFSLPPMEHVLLSGPSGLGKTSLAEILAKSLHRPLTKKMGSQLRSPEDLNFLAGEREPWSFVFIDEIHALPLRVEEALYEAMDEFKWKGEEISSFTLIGATTKEGELSKPLRSRFTIAETLEPYSIEDIRKIIKRSATILKLAIDDNAVEAIATRSRGVARIANQLLKRVGHYSSNITASTAQEALDNLRIDKYGLEMLDRSLLKTMRDNFDGPVGIDSLAAVAGEDISTVEAREPYLVKVGFVKRTRKGRVLTAIGEDYVKSIV